MSDISETLRSMRKLLATPESWNQKSSARDSEGKPVAPELPEAVCWCLSGALARVTYHEPIRDKYGCRLYREVHDFFDQKLNMNMIIFNDDPITTHDDILSLLDYAIEKAEQ